MVAWSTSLPLPAETLARAAASPTCTCLSAAPQWPAAAPADAAGAKRGRLPRPPARCGCRHAARVACPHHLWPVGHLHAALAGHPGTLPLRAWHAPRGGCWWLAGGHTLAGWACPNMTSAMGYGLGTSQVCWSGAVLVPHWVASQTHWAHADPTLREQISASEQI